MSSINILWCILPMLNSQIVYLPKSQCFLQLQRNMHMKSTYDEILPKYKVFVGVGKLHSSSFIPSPTTLIWIPLLCYYVPFVSLLHDSGSHSVIICISKIPNGELSQDAQLHSTNLILSGCTFMNAELPESFYCQLFSSMSFSCDYENLSNSLHVPHPQAATNNDRELK